MFGNAALKLPPKKVILRLPAPHTGGQDTFYHWNEDNPVAQCLVAPCGTKVGKTYGACLWMVKEALVNPKIYCAWIAPTYQKCRIAYRYIKAMLPNCKYFNPIDGRLEIELANGSFIKFMHGRDAEVTVEGEAIDRFVIDEAGKIGQQVWISLVTTITHTRGKGIVTGTPRGLTWYSDLFDKAQSDNPFFVWTQLKSIDSPFITQKAVNNAKKLLPPHLFEQYFNASFTVNSSVFGDLSLMWDESLTVPKGDIKFWKHPNKELRQGSIVHGIDIAKKHDYTVFYSTDSQGRLVGYCRFRHAPYPSQIIRLKTYLTNYFGDDNHIRYDVTGVGQAFEDLLNEAEIDATITPVTFTNASKAEMVLKSSVAIGTNWHKAPKIKTIQKEFASYDLTVTPSGLYKYSAPEGEHDDVVCAAMLSISGAYETAGGEQGEKYLKQLMNGEPLGELDNDDVLGAYANVAACDSDKDTFFETNDLSDELNFDFDNE